MTDATGPTSLVWRFHSLGDVVLTTGIVRALRAQEDLWVSSEARFRPLFEGWVPAERWLDRETIASLPPKRFERIIDLQGTPGAKRSARRLGRRVRSLRTRAAARRWLVVWGERFPRPRIPHALLRYAEAAGLPTSVPIETYRPLVEATASDLRMAEAISPELVTPAGAARVALIAGASRRSKAYPREALEKVAEQLRARGCEIWWIDPPMPEELDERPRGSCDRSPLGLRLRLPLPALKAALAHATLVIASDSGPMHLAAALETPVVGLFGSTVASFGFTPIGPRAGWLEASDVACRPCGVHGRDRCWLGHWRCLRDLTPSQVVTAALRALETPAEDHALMREEPIESV